MSHPRVGCYFDNREPSFDDRGVAPTLPPSPGEDPSATAGATLPPLAWQDVDLRHGCGGNTFVNADAVDDDNYNDDGAGNNDDGNDGEGGRDLALTLALVQPHPHPRDGGGNLDTSPPSWRLALDVKTFDGLARSTNLRHGRVPLHVAVQWAAQTKALPSPTWAVPLWPGLALGARGDSSCTLVDLDSALIARAVPSQNWAAPSWQRYAQYALVARASNAKSSGSGSGSGGGSGGGSNGRGRSNGGSGSGGCSGSATAASAA